MKFFTPSNFHGQNYQARFPLMSNRRMRAIKTARRHLFHKVPNGHYDPITHYHILDALLQAEPGQLFRATELTEALRERAPAIKWDPVTVGRVLNDMAEVLNDAAGWKVMGVNRRWDGTWYDVSGHDEAFARMEALLEDLDLLSQRVLREEGDGRLAKRVESPLSACPSVRLAL